MERITERKSEILMKNAKLWLTGCEDQTWMTFNSGTGRVTGIGQAPQPSDIEYEQVLDMEGRRVFPGLHDSHIHVSMLGNLLRSVDLRGCLSVKEMQVRIEAFSKSHPDLSWITGRSWEQDLIGRYPNKEDVDQICADKPVLLSRVCCHMHLLNSKALELAGITRDNPKPETKLLEYYPNSHPNAGEPTGIIYESAIDLVKKVLVISKAEKLAQIKAGLEACVQSGLTAVHSNEGSMWQEYCELAKANELPIRVFMAVYFCDRNVDNFPRPGERCGNMLSCDRIKIFADGALGICTAAISMPYINSKDNYGVLLHSQDELNSVISEANSAGFRLEVHVIGDQAADNVLTAMEKAQVMPEKRPLLTHCQILREDLIERMKKLGVIANIQPQFVTTDSRWAPKILPTELLKYAYPWKSLLNKGIVCAGGSDAPVEQPEPFLGIYDAIYRPLGERNREDQDIFRKDECLSVTEAIDLYTKAGAFTAMRESDLGQLLPGYMADFVILEKSSDPVKDPRQFASVKAEEVWVAGKRVFFNKKKTGKR